MHYFFRSEEVKYFFLGVPHLATCIFLPFYNQPDLCAGINPGMTLTPFPSSVLDKMRFKPTTFSL